MKPCCEIVENRRPGPGPRGLEAPPPPEVTVTHCVVCECRHFDVEVEAGMVGVRGATL